jgi:hypothetical protein
MVVIYSLPGVNREAVIQEQVARTAVLFSSSWQSDQNYLITPISTRALNNSEASETVHYRGSSGDMADSPDTFHQVGNEFSGAWFRSRSVSGQYLQAVRPSRSVLTVTNPQALATGEAPAVLSSFPAELDKVFLIDTQGHYWTCEHLEPGRKQSCSASEVEDFDKFWADARTNAGGKLAPFLARAGNRSGCFYATCTPPPDDRLATLSEVRWSIVQGICLGPWVASPAPENAP